MTSKHRFFPRRMDAALGAMTIACCLAMPALAQNTTSRMEGMQLSNDKPIQIESDQLEIKDQEKKAFFTGNVKVVQGTTTMRAGKMIVLYVGEAMTGADGNSNIEKIFIENSVVLNSGEQQATADNGEFDMASQTFVLTGKQVVLSQGPNVFTGCKLTVFMESGEAKLDSCGQRVQVLIDPKSQKKP